jgi:hypothetical protein
VGRENGRKADPLLIEYHAKGDRDRRGWYVRRSRDKAGRPVDVATAIGHDHADLAAERSQ